MSWFTKSQLTIPLPTVDDPNASYDQELIEISAIEYALSIATSPMLRRYLENKANKILDTLIPECATALSQFVNVDEFGEHPMQPYAAKVLNELRNAHTLEQRFAALSLAANFEHYNGYVLSDLVPSVGPIFSQEALDAASNLDITNIDAWVKNIESGKN